jgi:hypothetical protein
MEEDRLHRYNHGTLPRRIQDPKVILLPYSKDHKLKEQPQVLVFLEQQTQLTKLPITMQLHHSMIPVSQGFRTLHIIVLEVWKVSSI